MKQTEEQESQAAQNTSEAELASILRIRNLKASLPGHKLLWEFPTGDLRPRGIQLLLGRNGSGKSTLLRTLLGMNRRYSGTIDWNKDLETADHVAYLPESPQHPTGVNVEEWISWFHGIHPRNIKDLAPNYLKNSNSFHFSIDDLLKRKLSSLSKGQLQKVQIWQALYQNPQAVFFDEPFSGLDPWHKKELVRLIIEVSHSASLLISTHEIPAEFEASDSRIWLIDHRKQIVSTTLREFSL